MYKDILQSIDNIAIWPLVSFVIFFVFFLCLLWYVFTVDKKLISELEQLPLNETTPHDHAKSEHV